MGGIASPFCLAYLRKGLKDFFSFKMSLQANQHCVAGNVLPECSWLSGPDVEHVLATGSI